MLSSCFLLDHEVRVQIALSQCGQFCTGWSVSASSSKLAAKWTMNSLQAVQGQGINSLRVFLIVIV